VVGRSGAGKSTLVALIARFYDVGSGSVTIDGLDVRQITRDSLLDRLAIVTQQTFLFNRSIADNIRYGKRDATQQEVEQAARAANIHDFIVSQPEGVQRALRRIRRKLSGGQRQRIAIARAILKDADILVLDEAMAGLRCRIRIGGPRSAHQPHARPHDAGHHARPAHIQTADRILVIKDGRLVGHGTTPTHGAGGEYRKLYTFEFGAMPPGSE